MFLLLLLVLMMLLVGPIHPGLLVKWVSSLHWPGSGLDLRVGCISYVELLILDEFWAGETLSLEKAHPRCLGPGRPISVSAVPFGPGIDIWRSCRFIGAVMRSLCLLPGGLGRFLPYSIGANHCRLRHIGWGKCGHGLTSRPRESSSELLLALLAGLPLSGYRNLVMLLVWLLLLLVLLGRLLLVVLLMRFLGLVVLVLGRKRIRLNRKIPAHLAGFMVQSLPRVWEEVASCGTFPYFHS